MSENKATEAHNAQAVSDAEFEDVVLKSDLPVVVDFWAQWCAPCRAIAGPLEQLAGEFAGRLRVVKVDVDANKDWAKKLGVSGIPHLLYVHNGEIVNRQVGGVPRAKLHTDFENFLIKVGASEETAGADAQTVFEAAVEAAETRKNERDEAASLAFRTKAAAEFDAADKVRAEFDAIVDAEVAEQKKQLDAGSISEEEFERLWREASQRVLADPKHADIKKRREDVVAALNTGQCAEWKEEFFAELAASEAEYNTAVDAARAELTKSRGTPTE